MQDRNVLKDRFDRDGYARFEGLLGPAQLAEFRERVERYIADTAPTLEATRVLYEQQGGSRGVKQLVDMNLADTFFADLLTGPLFQERAAVLLGEEAVPQTVEYFNKPPRIGTPTPPHQDGFYFCLSPNHALTFWVALDDCDEQNGCMSYVRGSHRRGVIDHRASGVVGFSQGLGDFSWSDGDVDVMRVAAGDVLAHHSLTIHFAGTNRSERNRRSLGLIYYAASARRDPEAWERYQASLAAQRARYATGTTGS